jgi:hypothetical protein
VATSTQSLIAPAWRSRALMLLVVLGTLGASAVLGKLASDGLSLKVLALIALPGGLLGAMFLARYFQFAVLLLPLAALTLPRIELSTGTETRLPLSLLLACALTGIWCLAMLLRRRWLLTPSVFNRPLLVFGAICSISLVWGIAWRDPGLINAPTFIVTQAGALATILVSLSAGLLIGNFVTTPNQIKYVLGLFIGFGALMTLTQLLKINQSLLNDRGLWGLWTVAPAYGVLIAYPRLRWRWRALLALLIVANLYQTVVVNSFWVSGWVPTLVGMLAITGFHSRKLFVVLLLFGALAAYGGRGFFADVAQDNVDDGALERLVIWEQSWRVTSEHWLFGSGPAGYAIYYMTYYRDDARSTHNNYLDILAQFGFLGMGAWLWLAATSVWESWRVVRGAPPGLLRTTAVVAAGGWIGAMAAMLFGDWVLPFAYNQGIGGYKYTVYSWIFLGLLIAVRQLSSRARAAQPVIVVEVPR